MLRKGDIPVKTFEAPKMDVIKLDPKDIISTSGEDVPEETTKANSGGSSTPGLPCHGKSGNQPAC